MMSLNEEEVAQVKKNFFVYIVCARNEDYGWWQRHTGNDDGHAMVKMGDYPQRALMTPPFISEDLAWEWFKENVRPEIRRECEPAIGLFDFVEGEMQLMAL